MPGLRADIYDVTGTTKQGDGPVYPLSAEYSQQLDALGNFRITLPADDARVAQYVTDRSHIWLTVVNEGIVFRGIVFDMDYKINEDGVYTVEVSGPSVGYELVAYNTLLGFSRAGSTLAATLGDNATGPSLLAGSGWNPGALDVPASVLFHGRFDGLPTFQAAGVLADIFGYHKREDSVTLSGGVPVRNIDMGAMGTDSGLTFMNVDNLGPDFWNNSAPDTFPISVGSFKRSSADLWNSLVLVGGGEGLNLLTLRYSSRSTPYTIGSVIGPDGQTQYYIEDSASVTAYGRNRRVIAVKDAVAVANSAAAEQAAANALYDRGVSYLLRHKDPLALYNSTVLGLQHVRNGVQLIKPGMKVRTMYRNYAIDADGNQSAWLNINQLLWVMGFTRTIDESKSEWKIDLATTDRATEDEAQKQADIYTAVYALSVSPKNYTFQAPYVLQRISIDASTTATLYVKLDANIRYLHKAKLIFIVRPLRSNVSVAAAGGASVTGSSAGTSHNHSITTLVMTTQAAHNHTMFENASTAHLVATDGSSTLTGLSNVGNHNHTINGTPASVTSPTNAETQQHSHSLNAHTHGHTGVYAWGRTSGGAVNLWFFWEAPGAWPVMTYTSDASHTHTASSSALSNEASHTHSITLADHTHPLTYGIFTASNPVNPGITITINGVSRTVALGGPFNAVNTETEVDITQYLQSGTTEIPVQATNTIVFGATVLADIEAILRVDMTRSALLPV